MPSAQDKGSGRQSSPPRTRIATIGVAVVTIALLLASCSGGSDSSDSGSKDSTQGSQGTSTPTTFEPTGAQAAVAAELDTRGHTYVGDCANAKLPRDRGAWCSSLVEDLDNRKVYKVGPVGEDPELVLTVDRGNTLLTPGLEVDVAGGVIGSPRQLTLEQLLANAFITGNIILDQQAGIGRGLADLPGEPAAAPGGAGGGGAGGGAVTPPTPTVVDGGGAGPDPASAYPPPPPSITIDDPDVRVGGEIVVRGRNCGPNEPLVVRFDGKQVGSITADAQGNFVSSIDVPLGTTPGAHTVTVKGSVCELSIRVEVLGALAFTGAGNDTGTTVLVAVSVLVAGLVLLVGSRRRRSSGFVSTARE